MKHLIQLLSIGIILISLMFMLVLKKNPNSIQPKTNSNTINYIDLPEEFPEIQQGDTLVISKVNNSMRIWFYHSEYEQVNNSCLYIVK